MLMKELPTALLARACHTFLTLAYPGGPQTIPAGKRPFYELSGAEVLPPLLAPPVCEVLRTPEGRQRGYAWRLGSAHFPHLKLQLTQAEDSGSWVASVDTHDAFHFGADHPDAPAWTRLRAANAKLKEQIEQAWEAAGLLTFNGLLRRALGEA
jgi:hypothetical protein